MCADSRSNALLKAVLNLDKNLNLNLITITTSFSLQNMEHHGYWTETEFNNTIIIDDIQPNGTMLIPTKAKSSHEISILASFEEKADSSGGGATYVPVVALEYTLPGPIGGHRLPAPQSSPPQSSTTGRQRLPRHCNFRPKRYLRNTLAGESFICLFSPSPPLPPHPPSSSSSSSSTVNVISSKAFTVSSGLPKTATSGSREKKEKKDKSIN